MTLIKFSRYNPSAEYPPVRITPRPGSPAALRYAVLLATLGPVFARYRAQMENDSYQIGAIDIIAACAGTISTYEYLRDMKREAWWFGLSWGEDNVDRDLGL